MSKTSTTVARGQDLADGHDGIQHTALCADADVHEKQPRVDDADDAVLVAMGKQPKMKRRYNLWTRESSFFGHQQINH